MTDSKRSTLTCPVQITNNRANWKPHDWKLLQQTNKKLPLTASNQKLLVKSFNLFLQQMSFLLLTAEALQACF